LPHQAYSDPGRDDLFVRDTGPLGYDQGHYGGQHSERDSVIHSNAGRGDDAGYPHRETPSPLDDYERGFAARIAAQESQASRFFLPDEPAPQSRQAQPDRGYTPSHHYDTGGFRAQEQAAGHYGSDSYDGHQDQHGWAGDVHDRHEEGIRGGLPQTMSHGELDEDFFADEDEFEHDDQLAKPKRGRKKLIAAALLGAIGVGAGGAYVYKTMKGGGDGALHVIRAEKPSKELPSNPGGKQYANGEKSIYDRLTPDGPQTQAASMTGGPPPARMAAPAAAGSSLEERIDEALRKAQKSGDAPPAAAAPAGRPGGEQPTVVRGETYRPDGTRVDTGRPALGPSFGTAAQLPPPFGTAAPASAPAPQAPPAFKPTPAPSAPPQHPAAPSRSAALAAQSSEATAPGYYVSLKSAPDEKAIQKDLPALADKYRSVLGDIQLATKVADLGDKGVTYRAVAGPLNTRQEATELCNKLKGAGGSCFVTK
jgi:hypothetical protein